MGRVRRCRVLVVATGCSGFAGSPSQSAGTAVDSQPAVDVPESTVTVTVTAVVDGDTIRSPTRTGPVTRSGSSVSIRPKSTRKTTPRSSKVSPKLTTGHLPPRDRHERVVARLTALDETRARVRHEREPPRLLRRPPPSAFFDPTRHLGRRGRTAGGAATSTSRTILRRRGCRPF